MGARQKAERNGRDGPAMDAMGVLDLLRNHCVLLCLAEDTAHDGAYGLCGDAVDDVACYLGAFFAFALLFGRGGETEGWQRRSMCEGGERGSEGCSAVGGGCRVVFGESTVDGSCGGSKAPVDRLFGSMALRPAEVVSCQLFGEDVRWFWLALDARWVDSLCNGLSGDSDETAYQAGDDTFEQVGVMSSHHI